MIPFRLTLTGKKQHYAAKMIQSKLKCNCVLSRGKSSAAVPEFNNIASETSFTAAAAVAVMTLTVMTSASVDNSMEPSKTSQQPCQCDTLSKGSMAFEQKSSTVLTERGNVTKNQPRNVMVHRLRSLRGRSLNEKYKVDWKTVLGEGAYGSVHPARLAATGEKVSK